MHSGMRHFSRQVDGIRLHWVERGNASDLTPVVMLHGLNDCHLTWEFLAPELENDRRLFLLDLPGHGRSERPDTGYELVWYARVVASWLESLGLENLDVVGHSFGGGIAQMLLLECPQRIRRLALISPGGLGPKISVILRLASIPQLIELFGQPFMSLGTRLALKGASKLASKAHLAELGLMNSQPGSARAFARTVQDIINWRGQRRYFFHRVHEVSELPPIAVFWGTDDPIIPVKHGKAFAQAIEGVSLTLFEGCGHFVHHQKPRELAHAIRAFLDAEDTLAPKLRNAA
jgi:pimeloyl-ACP methyl ester carboxylesterase